MRPAAVRVGAVCRCAGEYGHAALASAREARRVAAYHKHGVLHERVDCRRCEYGAVTSVFPCAEHEGVWHWGHR